MGFSIIPSRKTVMKTAGFFGGLYMANNFIQERLEEVKQKMEIETQAQDNLKRRFQQTHETTSYTILALLPTLSSQILAEMNVETLTKELQSRSSKKPAVQPPPPQTPSLASSIEVVQEHDAHSVSSLSASIVQSWVDSSSNIAGEAGPSVSASLESLNSENASGSASVTSDLIPALSESILSQTSIASNSSDSRTKAELWNEVKMLTLTRTLTTLYSITLLCLLTTLQLTLLARSKYVQSVVEEEEQERIREKLEAQLTLSNMLFQGLGLGGGGAGLEGLEALLSGSSLGEDEDEEGCTVNEEISEETENKYLTMSWWLLHVGWKDVGERVRRGVEEVFEGVSLKTKLSAMDLHRLVGDVRRRVEHEVTFEGTERRTSFSSSLLPSTPETIQHVLVQGGFLPSSENTSNIPAYHLNPDTKDQPVSLHALSGTTHDTSTLSSSQLSPSRTRSISLAGTSEAGASSAPPYPHIFNDAKFLSLMDETQSVIASPDFARVLEVCLDRAVDVLFQGLMKNVFVDDGSSEDMVRVRLAGLMPGLARWSQLALDALPNELVDTLLAVHEVPCLSAILFGKFEDMFP
ncbi:Peroxin-3-domain-containing protein [Ephemerocybe angulata]|uniref:Peroxin-3-domain-containing protein n=1 Tax=Ephemerocybe angulata TaxID=980116 RepID=A0A8H6I4T4_9AGAR|nr:Peroxin-3-domain-containing protein [Tulosesus angulatus]